MLASLPQDFLLVDLPLDHSLEAHTLLMDQLLYMNEYMQDQLLLNTVPSAELLDTVKFK